MVTCLREGPRRARKQYHCDYCAIRIQSGDRYHVSANLYDGRIYDWRTCAACARDGVGAMVYDYCGMPDEGVGYDDAQEWAESAMTWYGVKAPERFAARDWLARAAIRGVA